MMDNEQDWRRSYSFPQSKSEARQNDVSPDYASGTLDETISIVKEKVWSFRDAWKGVAEVLLGFGLSPSVVGYSAVPFHEEGYIADKDEGEVALQSVPKEEVLPNKALARGSVHHRHVGEESNLLNRVEEVEEENHAFAESVRRDQDERRSLTSSGSWQTIDAWDDEEDQKKDA